MNVTLAEEHARIVMQALDIATKAGGLNVAARVLPLAQEIERQLTNATQADNPNSIPQCPPLDI